MNNNQILKNFSTLISCIRTTMEYNSFSDAFDEYSQLINTIYGWSENYRLNKNFNNITYEKSLQLHTLIDDIKERNYLIEILEMKKKYQTKYLYTMKY